ncbi:MAG: 50S ribosomal protein L23 [Gammaproteobacteria bacterium]|nr:50S ribosomal protein L23 [Gammaproteobacteria bacterium]
MNQERILRVLLGPHISEKSTRAAEAGNQIVFKVLPDASKLEIKQAVEKLFEVNVQSVSVVNCKGKERRTKFGTGRRNHTKKAYVRLQAGQDINLMGKE